MNDKTVDARLDHDGNGVMGGDAAAKTKVVAPVEAPPEAPPALEQQLEDEVVAPEPPPPFKGNPWVLVWLAEGHAKHEPDDLVRADPDAAAQLLADRLARRATPEELDTAKPVVAFEG